MASDGDSVASNIGRTDKEALGDEEKVLDEEIEDSKIGRQIVLAIVIICALLLLGKVWVLILRCVIIIGRRGRGGISMGGCCTVHTASIVKYLIKAYGGVLLASIPPIIL